MYAVTHTSFSSFPSSLISLNYILILQWGTQEGVNIFHFRNFQRSFVSVYKGQNTKLFNERWEDFWHPREYKPALASLQITSGTLSYVMFSCAIYAREKAQPTWRNVKKKNCWDYFNDYQVLLPVFLVAVLLKVSDVPFRITLTTATYTSTPTVISSIWLYPSDGCFFK